MYGIQNPFRTVPRHTAPKTNHADNHAEYEIRRDIGHITKFVPFGLFPTKHDAKMRLTRLREISPNAKFTIHRVTT